MRQHLKFIAAAVAALALIGCKFATDTPAATPSAEFRAEATGGSRVARAAVDEARRQLDKPAPSVDQARPMLDIAAAALPESDQPARDLVAGVVADNGKLRESQARVKYWAAGVCAVLVVPSNINLGKCAELVR